VGPQNFIFVSLNRFGSLINVTITITRKFFTILLSVIVYGHHVRAVPCRAVPCPFARMRRCDSRARSGNAAAALDRQCDR
jgi:UDP-galactose transporter B1